MIRNLTPHAVNVEAWLPGGPDMEIRRIEPDPAGPARLVFDDPTKGRRHQCEFVDVDDRGAVGAMPVAPLAVDGAVTGLPEPREGVLLLVALPLALALRGQRNDLVAVHDVVREDDGPRKGQPKYARALGRVIV